MELSHKSKDYSILSRYGLCIELKAFFFIAINWEIFQDFLLSSVFFQNQPFRKILSEIPYECQTD